MSTLKTFTELTLEQQDELRSTYTQYYVQTDPHSLRTYIRFMGENVDLESVRRQQVLLG